MSCFGLSSSTYKPLSHESPTPTEQDSMNSSVILDFNSLNQKAGNKTSICFKIFIVVTVALAAVTIVVGALALVAAQGSIPGSMDSIAHLGSIGVANSSVMLAGGVVLFVLGITAWGCHLRKDHYNTTPLLSPISPV